MPLTRLISTLQGIIPQATLVNQRLPQVPDITLALIDSSYPQHALDDASVRRIMDHPLYWVFCWASGQVLARYLLDNPELVAGKRVLDFGAGSGVAAIAAAKAGATQVIACDIDEAALLACQHNASLNGVQLELLSDFEQLEQEVDVILVADVLYDRSNLEWLDRFTALARTVLVADSRVRDFDVPPFKVMGSMDSSTIPDLDESSEFGRVSLYVAND